MGNNPFDNALALGPAPAPETGRLNAPPVAADPFASALQMPADPPPGQALSQALGGTPAPQPEPMSAGDVFSQAGENFGASAEQFAEDFSRIFTDPIGTVKGLGRVLLGTVQKLIPGDQEHEKYADAVGDYFSERYGGFENLKRSFASDPVGVFADATTLLTGGGAAVARAPGLAGQVGKIAAKVGTYADPVVGPASAAVVGAKLGAKGVTEGLGFTTGAKGASVQTAFTSGMGGGTLAENFRSAMRGNMPFDEVLDEAKAALNRMYETRSQQYVAGMKSVRSDPAVLSFSEISEAVRAVDRSMTFKGIDLSSGTANVRSQAKAMIADWKAVVSQDVV